MVLIHIKKGEESAFLADIPAATNVSDAIDQLVGLHNGRLRVERLCAAVEDLAEYGAYKPVQEHGYLPEDLDKFADEDKAAAAAEGDGAAASSSSDGAAKKKEEPAVPVVVDGREYLKRADPTGRRNGLAPIATLAETMKNTCIAAREAVSKNKAKLRVPLTDIDIKEHIDLLRGAVMMAYPMGLPEYDPVQEIIDDNEDLGACIHARDVLDPNTASLWWAGKEVQRGKALSDYVGRNDKTTIIAKLQRQGSGAPMREPPLDEQGRRELVAYYHKKEKEFKELELDDDYDENKSPWANPSALKAAFQGIGTVSWRPR